MFCTLCDLRLNKTITVWSCRFCGRGGLCGVCMRTHICDRKIAGMVGRIV